MRTKRMPRDVAGIRLVVENLRLASELAIRFPDLNSGVITR